MVGFYRQHGTVDEFAIIVNRDNARPIECDIIAGVRVKGILSVSAAYGADSNPTLTDGTMHLCLEPGEGRLFRLQFE